MTSIYSYTSDFRQEFEAETNSLMRRRFRWFAWCHLGLFTVTHFLIPAIKITVAYSRFPAEQGMQRIERVLQSDFAGRTGLLSVVALGVALTAICLGAMQHTKSREYQIRPLVLFTQWFFFAIGAIDVATAVFIHAVGFPWLIMISHVMACALVPWTPKQSLRPIVPIICLNIAAIVFLSRFTLESKVALSVASLAAVVPGLVICALRHTRRLDRFQLHFLRTRYGQLSRELGDARRIHESLFPKPLLRGNVRFDYRYLPMRLIGGDYLYFKQSLSRLTGATITNAILLDVTGHGIAAALTVNRLYGEIERFFAEHPGARPGDVLANLNRYVNLTLANHSIYATALCVRIDPASGDLEYASGGHPPAFIRAIDGSIDELPSTAFVLGAVPPDDFQSEPARKRFGPGDTLIAYTDGAIEARNSQGRMFGVAGLQRFIASSGKSGVYTGGWAPALLGVVDSHRAGAPHDDTLIVEIYRTVGQDTDSSKPSASRMRTREYIVVR
ncbi:MAG: PP2C family protein-serine/threonine phosphatase [Phycisphaerales bacterium]